VGGTCGTNEGEDGIDSIKTELSEIGLGGVDWTGVAQDRYSWRTLANAVMNLRVS
jgi:hypothetical protein